MGNLVFENLKSLGISSKAVGLMGIGYTKEKGHDKTELPPIVV
jgi:hypothetical protein